MKFRLTAKSTNKKTGPIPVSTTTADTCPTSCPFKDGACYAKHGPLAIVWKNTERDGMTLDAFCDAVRALPKGQLWRHNQAGDLPGEGDALDVDATRAIVAANEGRRGFTYTHKPLTPEVQDVIREANTRGFTVNLSANNMAHADELADLGIGPVCVTLPTSYMGKKGAATPKGRWVVMCPAQAEDSDINCANCKMCAVAGRKAIIGFAAHGSGKKKVV